jgi:fatty-acyl-CoA synthase
MGETDNMPLFGLMQDWPLTVDKFLEHAQRWHGTREIVSRRADGSIDRRDYAQLYRDAKRMSGALLAFGIRQGDRVATFAMNGAEHLAAWYGIAGIGAVYHTLNPRLFQEHLAYIVNHADDRVIMADGSFAPILENLLLACPGVELVIFLSAPAQTTTLPVPWTTLDEFTAGHDGDYPWGNFDERCAAGLCYTSGTTGAPKGVLYSHRSNFLHALATLQPDVLNLSAKDVILPIVPMFHANAWGLTFAAPAVGAKLVLPGPRLDGASVCELIHNERVTFAAGVPTVWLAMFDYMDATGVDAGPLERIITGGSAMPERVYRRFQELGIEATHAWGMTEMSPLGTVAAPTPHMMQLPSEAQLPYRLKQGRPALGVDMRLVDDSGATVAHDGRAFGRLQTRGPGVVRAYLGHEYDATDDEGWFDTGDIATIDEHGFMQITDRAKDIIKSGGEWISSVDVENAALSHPQIALAAAIAVPDPKWQERPVLFVTLRSGEQASAEEIIAFLAERMAKWWLPDAIHFIEEMPLGATGKVDKKVLREKIRNSSPR